MVVRRSVVFSFDLDKIEHGFKLTNQCHIMINSFEFIIGEIFLFIFYRFLILIDRNWLKFYKTRLTGFFWI